jgi:mycofactocin precursor
MQPAVTLPPEGSVHSDGPRDEVDDEIVDEVLVEEISIDGMCGVY